MTHRGTSSIEAGRQQLQDMQRYRQAESIRFDITRQFSQMVYPGCSCHECGGIAQDGSPPGTWFNACPQCHNKRCPKCDNHRFKCTGSNEPGQVGELEEVRQ